MGTDDGWKLKLGALLVVGVSLGMSEVVGIIDKEGAVDGALLGTVLGTGDTDGDDEGSMDKLGRCDNVGRSEGSDDVLGWLDGDADGTRDG